MNSFTHLAARTGAMASQQLIKCAHSQVNPWIGRRSISWMAFEGPSPSLYKNVYKDVSRVERATFYESAKTEVTLKNVSEIVEATEVNGGFQGHDLTLPSSTTTTNNKDATMLDIKTSASLPADSRYLCTTLIKIPGCPATWPCKEKEAAIINSDATSTTVPIIKPMKP